MNIDSCQQQIVIMDAKTRLQDDNLRVSLNSVLPTYSSTAVSNHNQVHAVTNIPPVASTAESIPDAHFPVVATSGEFHEQGHVTAPNQL